MTKKIILILISIFLLCGCKSENIETEEKTETKKDYYLEAVIDIYDEYVPMLNTVTKVTYFEEEYSEELLDGISDVLIKYHKLLDNYHYYRDDNDELIKNIKYLNDYYGNEEGIDVSAELIDILNSMKKMMKLTKGYFNPFIGELIESYDGKFSNFPVVCEDIETEVIDKYLNEIVDYEDIDQIVEIAGNHVVFHKYKDIDKLSINLGAFSKGYVADRVLEYLADKEETILLNEGTSTIVGHSDIDRTWNVGIRDPHNKYSYIFALELGNNSSLSTSGSDQNYYLLDDGTVRCHILNPFTGYSENYYSIVTVLSESAMVSDVLSTALFSIEDDELSLDIIKDIESEYNVNVDVCYISEYDSDELIVRTTLDRDRLLNRSTSILSTEVIDK
ncbi:MAG: FAD:protein FMN transferase [Erysipelotrichaceae bacterium]